MPVRGYAVASPAELAAAAKTGMPLVELGYRISGEGRLVRQAVASSAQAELMGVSDAVMKRPPEDVSRLAGDIYYEMKSRKYAGVLLDFEGQGPEMYPFVSRLSHLLSGRGVRHFVPVRFHSAAPSALLLVPAAVSGGSFADMCAAAERRCGVDRVAYELAPIREDFLLPSMGARGKRLEADALRALKEKYAPSVFYSRELVCRYFTYRNAGGEHHFILYDDMDTIREKMRLIGERGDFSAFILFSDLRALS